MVVGAWKTGTKMPIAIAMQMALKLANMTESTMLTTIITIIIMRTVNMLDHPPQQCQNIAEQKQYVHR